jgi:hypothetical protein
MPLLAYSVLATCVLLVHALFILWVIFGSLLVRSRERRAGASVL